MKVAVTMEQCWHRVPGGTATSIIALTKSLAERGDVELIGVAAHHGNPPDPAFQPSIEIEHLRLPRPLLYEAWHRLSRPSIESVTGQVDLVHATAIAVPPTRAPLVMTIHDLAFLADESHFTPRGLRFFKRGTQLARDRATLVMVPSQATRRECLAAGFDAARLRVVPWGVDLKLAAEAEVEAIVREESLPDSFVLFVGTIEPRKNLPRLVEAMARLDRPETQLVIAGPDGWNEDLGALVEKLPGRVKRIGFLDRARLAALYRAATVVAYPSLREGFGLPVLEAMSQGASVITSRGTATEEAAGEAAVLIDPTSVDEITAALDELLGDSARRESLGSFAADRARNFSWTTAADRAVEVYAEALSMAKR